MKPRLHETRVEHEVPFHDVDMTHRVWHGHYYKYLELARTALFRGHGLDDEKLIPGRYALYVVETRCRYTFPLRYRDRMRVSAWFRDVERRLAVAYEITNLSHGRRSARGLTTLAVVDDGGRMRMETPPEIVERIRANAG